MLDMEVFVTIMVSREEKRTTPEYSLARVRELAEKGMVSYASSRVEHNVFELGYSPEDVHDCLASLESVHFKESILYPSRSFWMDVYLRPFVSISAPRGQIDDLYVKFSLNRDLIVIHLHSFHI